MFTDKKDPVFCINCLHRKKEFMGGYTCRKPKLDYVTGKSSPSNVGCYRKNRKGTCRDYDEKGGR